ncbi:hypothetical protein Dimus_027776 [Dionaea muscipula]
MTLGFGIRNSKANRPEPKTSPLPFSPTKADDHCHRGASMYPPKAAAHILISTPFALLFLWPAP